MAWNWPLPISLVFPERGACWEPPEFSHGLWLPTALRRMGRGMRNLVVLAGPLRFATLRSASGPTSKFPKHFERYSTILNGLKEGDLYIG